MILNGKPVPSPCTSRSITLCLVSSISEVFLQTWHPLPLILPTLHPEPLRALCKVAPHEITIWGEWAGISGLPKHSCLCLGFPEQHKASIICAGMSRCFKSFLQIPQPDPSAFFVIFQAGKHPSSGCGSRSYSGFLQQLALMDKDENQGRQDFLLLLFAVS